MPRTKLFSITIADCRVDTFTVGGHGGSGKDTSNTGVRVTHEPSGASAEGTRTRSQLQNKRIAFRKMAESPKFHAWVKAKVAGMNPIDKIVEEAMSPEHIREEVYQNGVWTKLEK